MTGDSGSNERRAGRGQSESRAPEGTRRPPCRACALTFTLPPESGPNSAILLNILSQGRSRGRQERAQAGGVSRAEGFRLEVGESPGLAAPNCLLHTRGGAVGHSAPRWESGAEGVCGWGRRRVRMRKCDDLRRTLRTRPTAAVPGESRSKTCRDIKSIKNHHILSQIYYYERQVKANI